MAGGIDLLIVSPNGSGDLDGELEEVSEKIPVVFFARKQYITLDNSIILLYTVYKEEEEICI